MINLYLHAGSENHGCEAIVRSTIDILNEECVLYSSNADSDIRYGINELCEIKRDITVPYERNSLQWFLSSLQIKLTGKLDLFVKYQRQRLLSGINKNDICLSIGGDNYCYPGTEIIAAVNSNIKKKGAKTVLWGCSVEPSILDNPQTAKDIASFDLITARESISYEALKKVNPNTIQVADPAFTLKTEMLPLPEGWQENNMIGINASPLILDSGKDSNTVYTAYKMLIQYILDNTECCVALVPHVVVETNNDLKPLTRLYNEFKESGRVILLGDYNCMELKGFIARCRFFVGARTHATIAAYSSGVPTLVLGYSVKSRGIAKDLFGTYENYVLPVQSLNNPDELTKCFVWIMEHEEEIRNHLKEILPEYAERAYLGKKAMENL